MKAPVVEKKELPGAFDLDGGIPPQAPPSRLNHHIFSRAASLDADQITWLSCQRIASAGPDVSGKPAFLNGRDEVSLLQLQRHGLDRAVAWIIGYSKSEFAAHLKHRDVVGENLALDVFQAFAAGIADHQFHQLPSESAALEIGAHQDGILSLFVIRIGVEAYDTQQLSACLFNRHEGHRACIIELGEAGEKRMAERLDWTEEAEAPVVCVYPFEKPLQTRPIPRPEGADH